MKKEKFDSIKTLKRMGIVPRTRHYEQMVSMSKWIFIVGFVTVILAMNTGCASIETTAYGPYVDQIIDWETKERIRQLPNTTIELAEGVCYNKTQEIFLCPDGIAY